MLFNRSDDPPKLPHPLEIWTPYLIHGFLGPLESTLQSASRSLQPFLQGSRTWPTDTDHATPSVAIAQYSYAMRSNNIQTFIFIRLLQWIVKVVYSWHINAVPTYTSLSDKQPSVTQHVRTNHVKPCTWPSMQEHSHDYFTQRQTQSSCTLQQTTCTSS